MRTTIDGLGTVVGQFLSANVEGPFQLLKAYLDIFRERALSGPPVRLYSGHWEPRNSIYRGHCSYGARLYSQFADAENRFFVWENDGQRLFATSVQLFKKASGFLMDEYGSRLLVFKGAGDAIPVGEERIDYSQLTRFHYPQGDITPRATTEIDPIVNLTPSASPIEAMFNHMDDSTFNYALEMSAYDDVGLPHSLIFYFVFADNGGDWSMYYNFQANNTAPSPTGPVIHK